MRKAIIKVRVTRRVRIVRRVSVSVRSHVEVRTLAIARLVVAETRGHSDVSRLEVRDEMLERMRALLPEVVDDDDVYDAIDAACDEAVEDDS